MKYHKDLNRVLGRDYLPLEKWIVLLRDNYNIKQYPRVFFRMFLAKDYYDAYDIVRSYSERSNLEIIWFKEKRECPEYHLMTFAFIEFFCTYCNRKFNDNHHLKCDLDECNAIFCSSICRMDHIKLKHVRS
jgi:hypothetical protein